MTARILIADDHAIIRDGLRMILTQNNLTVAGEAKDGRDAVAKAASLSPDVIIMDLTMPELNGIEATRRICEKAPGPKVLMLSMHYSLEHVHRAMQAGAWGYILKESAGVEVVHAVEAVMRGHRYFGQGVAIPFEIRSTEGQDTRKSPLDSLSQREREVLQLVVEGRTSADIAGTLSLSPKSVETYRSRLMLKLGINNIPSLVKFALLHGITPAE